MVREFMQMKGARFSSVFGNLYGVKVQEETDVDVEADAEELEDGSPCPECGDPLFNVTLTAEELDELGAGAWITNKHGTVH
jgi:DNA repair exonuclease SbcCD ATPase subunit